MGQALTKLSLQEFLDWENQQPERHEFHRGEVFSMVGARREHGLIALNIAASLKTQLKGSPCRVFADSMKLKVGTDTILYPDVFVTCDAADLRTEQVFTAPTVVVECFPRRRNRMTEAPSSRCIAACLACANTCWSTPTRARCNCSGAMPTACSPCTT